MPGIRKNAFTLIELLVVIAIIALLLGILLPNIMAAREEARRAACASNVSGIVKAAHVYAEQFRGFLPAHMDASEVNVRVGMNRLDKGNPDNPVDSRSSSRAWFLLAKLTYASVDLFRCPSDRDVYREGYNLTDPDTGDELWDFKPNEGDTAISYALQVNKIVVSGDTREGEPLTNSADHQLALVADQNGLMRVNETRDDFTSWTRDGDAVNNAMGDDDDDDVKKGNSPNHEWAGERDGQNVAYLDAHAVWQETFRCGIEGDNIWTIMTDRDDEGDPDPRGFGNASNRGLPDNDMDSYLMP